MAKPLNIVDLRGGRNGIDSPIDPTFPSNQCVEAVNVDFFETPLGRRRMGTDSFSTPVSSGSITQPIKFLERHLPGGDETTAEHWLCDNAGAFWRTSAALGFTYNPVTITPAGDTVSAFPIRCVSFNGKLWLFYNSPATRCHLYDPDLPGIRRVGLAPPGQPTAANGPAGPRPSETYYFRARVIQVVSGKLVRRSEPGTYNQFTTGAATAYWTVNRPTLPGEGETHWEIEVSPDNKVWYILRGFERGSHISVASASFNDPDTWTTYVTFDIPDLLGTYALFPSCKFGITDGNRIIMAGDYETTLGSRVYFSTVLGSTNKADDERTLSLLTIKGYQDINEKDGGDITGLGGPIQGVFWAFKYRSITRFVPTGDLNAPYSTRKITNRIGAISHEGIVMAETRTGEPCLYFMSHRGVYRLASDGIKYCFRDNEDYWFGKNGKSKVNLSATTPVIGVYYSELGQVWYWVATGNSNTPNVLFVLDIKQNSREDSFGLRGGWSVFTGGIADIGWASMWSEDHSGGVASLRLKPMIAKTSTGLQRCDSATSNTDNGTTYQAYVKTRSVVPVEAIGNEFTAGEAFLTAKAATGVNIQLTYDRDFNKDVSTSSVSLTAEATETRVVRRFTAATTTDVGALQVQIGDAAAGDIAQWSLDALTIPMTDSGDLGRA